MKTGGVRFADDANSNAEVVVRNTFISLEDPEAALQRRDRRRLQTLPATPSPTAEFPDPSGSAKSVPISFLRTSSTPAAQSPVKSLGPTQALSPSGYSAVTPSALSQVGTPASRMQASPVNSLASGLASTLPTASLASGRLQATSSLSPGMMQSSAVKSIGPGLQQTLTVPPLLPTQRVNIAPSASVGPAVASAMPSATSQEAKYVVRNTFVEVEEPGLVTRRDNRRLKTLPPTPTPTTEVSQPDYPTFSAPVSTWQFEAAKARPAAITAESSPRSPAINSLGQTLFPPTPQSVIGAYAPSMLQRSPAKVSALVRSSPVQSSGFPRSPASSSAPNVGLPVGALDTVKAGVPISASPIPATASRIISPQPTISARATSLDSSALVVRNTFIDVEEPEALEATRSLRKLKTMPATASPALGDGGQEEEAKVAAEGAKSMPVSSWRESPVIMSQASLSSTSPLQLQEFTPARVITPAFAQQGVSYVSPGATAISPTVTVAAPATASFQERPSRPLVKTASGAIGMTTTAIAAPAVAAQTLKPSSPPPGVWKASPPSAARPLALAAALPMTQPSMQSAQATLSPALAVPPGAMLGYVWALSQDAQGCRRVQEALDTADESTKCAIAEELRGHVLEALHSPHANFVVRKCVEKLPSPSLQFIIDELLMSGDAAMGEAARHRYGCRIIEALFTCCEPSQLNQVSELLLAETSGLCSHMYGNFVMQKLLENGTPEQRSRVIEVLHSEVSTLGPSFYASAVYGTALRTTGDEECVRISQAVAASPGVLANISRFKHGGPIVELVVQRLDEPSQQATRAQLAAAELQRQQAAVAQAQSQPKVTRQHSGGNRKHRHGST